LVYDYRFATQPKAGFRRLWKREFKQSYGAAVSQKAVTVPCSRLAGLRAIAVDSIEQQLKLNQKRVVIFQYLCNGVPSFPVPDILCVCVQLKVWLSVIDL